MFFWKGVYTHRMSYHCPKILFQSVLLINKAPRQCTPQDGSRPNPSNSATPQMLLFIPIALHLNWTALNRCTHCSSFFKNAPLMPASGSTSSHAQISSLGGWMLTFSISQLLLVANMENGRSFHSKHSPCQHTGAEAALNAEGGAKLLPRQHHQHQNYVQFWCRIF